MFTIKLIKGSAKEVYNNDKIIISEELSTRYFGNEEPMGKQITQVVRGIAKEYIVGGVFQKSSYNTSFNYIEAFINYNNYFDLYPNFSDNNWGYWNTTFVKLKPNTNPLTVESQLRRYIEPQNSFREGFKLVSYYLEPFEKMAQNVSTHYVRNHWFRPKLPLAAVTGPSILAVIMFLIACFNLTNTTVAISGSRLKEIGLRKAFGGSRKQLIYQYFLRVLWFAC